MDDEEAIRKLRNPTAKELATARLKILERIRRQSQESSRADAVTFEDLGVDMLMVDEAHLFKKPPMATRMKMRGLQKQMSNRSVQLKFLTDYIKNQNSGRGVHLFTGTPITNTLAEIFHMQRYVMHGEMKRDGIGDWDGWFNTFATGVSDVEFTAAGDYQPVTKLAGFINNHFSGDGFHCGTFPGFEARHVHRESGGLLVEKARSAWRGSLQRVLAIGGLP
jgi:N12 class adenine-specific DNA methylase